MSVYKVGPSTRHLLVDEDDEGGLPIGFGIILHGSYKKLVYHCIGFEAFDSLAKVPQSVLRLALRLLRLVDGIADRLGCSTNT